MAQTKPRDRSFRTGSALNTGQKPSATLSEKDKARGYIDWRFKANDEARATMVAMLGLEEEEAS